MATQLREAATVSSASMIEQCKSVLRAGGTVYLGENHTGIHAREIAIEVLEARCVQHLCVEYATSDQWDGMSKQDLVEVMAGRDKFTRIGVDRGVVDISLVDVANRAVADEGCAIKFIDKPEKRSMKRHRHMREQVKACRSNITQVGRGVLVIVGAQHLEETKDGHDTWKALQEMIYDGHSFTYGRYGSCYMIWQLS